MEIHEAEALAKKEGYQVKELIEQEGDTFIFTCEHDGGEIEVAVVSGVVYASPT